ncbi:auxin-responsive GH3 family protein [Arabidopsis thaliana]|uniref:Auxin-responsive GH3 family protein n=1 Tax=Arabidopsis thaliana TaxID=3702 RepID=Q9C736_ARATH|nr:auxin-responsive GH3 family protein [Arabidopsis thaliana]AAG60120.1 Nt-gh3 deduced protein, putative [Arabidopsis thaliana]AEE32336.1 auxin-responsive GH3 family protein [Arabidopsis thaliana]|eukprot:NP_175300.1 auxin-responsive GH3 family protein [Arabidopsis thaliana]
MMNPSLNLMDLEELTSNAKQIQEDVLEEILTLNANTEYLHRFLHGSSDKVLFKKNVPVVTYDDVKPYIERVANGEPSDVISGGPITMFLRSTGTSGGKQKVFPVNDKYIEKLGYVIALRSLAMSKHFDSGGEQGKAMEFHCTKPPSATPSGLPRDEVVRVGAAFAFVLVRAIDFLEKHWKELCSNIRSGHVSEWITDLEGRNAVSTILRGPDSILADVIEQECSHKSWEGIITRLWPKAKYIDCIITGQMSQYIPMLEFYSNKLPIVSTTYGSSESTFGMNVDPLCKPQDTSYTCAPNISYFEFLPVDHKGDMASIVDLVDVKLGCYYEPVVTNYFGLHRYLIGDILQVTGFYNNTPQFRFVHRKNVVLSVRSETTTEEDILKALNHVGLVLESSDLMLMGFTCYADISTFPGHYVFYWELKAKDVQDVFELEEKVMVKCCSLLEESFDEVYRKNRSKDECIGPLEIRVVQQGTFDSLMEYFISQGGSIAQYKTPICINSSEALAVLENKVLARFFSEKSPPLDS